MAELDDERTPKLGRGPGINTGPTAQDDPRINPDGVYSGMTKRNAITDGSFVNIGGMPKDMRHNGRMTYKNTASGRRETS